MLHIVLQFSNAFPDIVQCLVRALLFEEELRFKGVDNNLQTAHVQDSVVQVGIQPGHLVEQKQLVHMHRIASNDQLPLLDAHPNQVLKDVLLGLLDRNLALQTGLDEARL